MMGMPEQVGHDGRGLEMPERSGMTERGSGMTRCGTASPGLPNDTFDLIGFLD